MNRVMACQFKTQVMNYLLLFLFLLDIKRLMFKYTNSADPITVYESSISSSTHVSKGSGTVNTELNITDVNSTSTNYLKIYVAVNSTGDLIFGGYVKIAPIN